MTARAHSWIGRHLDNGRYRVTDQLGEGGMGFVLKAIDTRLDAEVVIKIVRPALLDDPEFAARFALELDSLIKLAHPHIVKVTDRGTDDGVPFAVMQYLPGGSLLDRPRPDPPAHLRHWLPAIADALDFIHRKGFIHRDVKPANILFDAENHAFLADFGIAKAVAGRKAKGEALTETGVALGTPQYMAPELVMGKPADGRADQYALAMTVYQMLAGKVPFDADVPSAVMVMQTTKRPKPLTDVIAGFDPDLWAAIDKALAKDKAKRFADCASFAAAVIARAGGPVARPKPVQAKPATETAKQQHTAAAKAVPAAKAKSSAGPWALLALIPLAVAAVAVPLAMGVFTRPPADEPQAAPPPPVVSKQVVPPPLPPPADTGEPTRPTAITLSPRDVQLEPGQATTVSLTVERAGSGLLEVGLDILDLPVGVTPVAPPTVRWHDVPGPDGRSRTIPVMFRATADAPPGQYDFRVVLSGPRPLTRTFPLTVKAGELAVSAEVGGPLLLRAGQSWREVTVKLDRSKGYRGAVKVALDGLPPGVTCEAVTVAAGGTTATLKPVAAADATPTSSPAQVVAAATAGPARFTAKPFDLHVAGRFEENRWPRKGPPSPVTALAVGPRRGVVIFGCRDGTVGLWPPIQTGAAANLQNAGAAVSCVAVNDNERQAAVGLDNGHVLLFEIGPAVLRPAGELVETSGHRTPVVALQFGTAPGNPAEPALASTSSDRFIRWGLIPVNGKRRALPKANGTLQRQVFPNPHPPGEDFRHPTPRADRFISGVGGSTLSTWSDADPAVGKSFVDRFTAPGAVRSAAVSATGNRVAAALRNGTVAVWDTGVKRPLDGSPYAAPGATAVALSADGTHLAIGYDDGFVRWWKLPE